MILLRTEQSLFIVFNGGLKLFDIFCSTLSKGGLRLSITLLAFL